MATLTQVRTAIADTVKSRIADLIVYDTVEEMVETPALIVEPLNADFTQTMGFDEAWWFHLFLLVDRADTGANQRVLDELIDDVRRVLHQNSTLGLANTDSTVHSMIGYGGKFDVAKIEHVGAVLKIQVFSDGFA